jgi:quercetin dioxygenase-like cupin family protein
MSAASFAQAKAVFTLSVASILVSQDPPTPVRIVTPADLRWEDSPRAPGVRIASLMGDATKPDSYFMRARYSAHLLNGPHYHNQPEQITVLSGTWYFGQGPTLDSAAAIPLLPGAFVVVPAKAWHWAFTQGQPAEVDIHGVGPRTTVYAR